MEFDDFFAAIGGQESGGNYGAVNSRTGASGKYQIMPANIGPWSQKYLGYRVSVGQFRSSPQVQEELARAVLRGYWDQYGARGAAAAWYSGNPSAESNYKRFRSNEPSIGEYVDQVLARVGNGRSDYAAAAAEVLQTTRPQDATPQDSADGPLGLYNVESAGLGMTVGDGKTQTGLKTTPGVPLRSEVKAPSANGVQYQSSGATGLRQAVVDKALSVIGTPYLWGGSTPGRGIDCSGLTQNAYASIGVGMAHYHANQLAMGRRVSLDQLQPGDLVGWSGAAHVAMYVGNGQIVEAPRPGKSVSVRNIGSGWDKANGIYGVSMEDYLK